MINLSALIKKRGENFHKGHLTKLDRMLITRLREAGVLAEVVGRSLDLKDGVIMIPCADGDQMADLFTFETGLFKEQKFQPRIHTLALNGGALLILANSSVRREGNEDAVILQHIRDGYALKGINLVILYAHAPCGAAGIAKLNFQQVIELLIAAKTRVKEEIPGLKVACFCHVDWGEGRKRTYFVSRDKWIEWTKKN